MGRRTLLAVLILPLLAGTAGGRQARAAEVAPVAIAVTDFAFDPAEVALEAGGTVQWVNRSPGTRHAVTAENGAFDSNAVASEGLAGGAAFSHTFAEPGTYAYYCTIHTPANPAMKGTVVVEAAGAAGDAAGAPTTARQTEDAPSRGPFGIPIPAVAAVFVVLVAVAFYTGYRSGPKQRRRKQAE
ncbi:MAG: plastocyanin/azurin family copper-binding protein [Actinomycetota bacterium]